jgi:hypothetical protein
VSAGARPLRVVVAYADETDQANIAINVAPGATVRSVIERSRILQRFPGIDLCVNKVGIFGRPADLDQPVSDGDRVEIYRPLKVDPKEIRRRRAEARK